MQLPFVCIIILNWNNEEDTRCCLSSIKELNYPNKVVLVVDNGSTSGSIAQMKLDFPGISFLMLKDNQGYAGGNNAGIKWALEIGADWILLLNSDTTLAFDSLIRLVSAGEFDPDVGIVGPTVYYQTADNIIQSAGGVMDRRWQVFHRGQNQLDQGQFPTVSHVDWISGCAILLRSKMIEQIGLLDERFFLYQEELDLCLRAKRMGWSIVQDPCSHIWHSGVDINYEPKPYVTYYMTRNWLLLLKKNKAGLLIWLFTITQIIRTLTSWSINPKWKLKINHRNAMYQGLFDFIFNRWGPIRI